MKLVIHKFDNIQSCCFIKVSFVTNLLLILIDEIHGTQLVYSETVNIPKMKLVYICWKGSIMPDVDIVRSLYTIQLFE